MFTYIHDKLNHTVYRVPLVPEVEEMMQRGKRAAWKAWCVIDVTSASNVLGRHGWRDEVRHHARQVFNSEYTKEEVISYFISNHTPVGEVIDEAEYSSLRAKYHEEALNNK